MIPNFKLSEHFNFYELTNSDDHPELVKLNRIYLMEHPQLLVNMVLWLERDIEPLRVFLDTLMRIVSGFRFPLLNIKVGGSETSQHPEGEAIDFTCPEIKNLRTVYDALVNREIDIIWNQLRYYEPVFIGTTMIKSDFIHISKATGTNDMRSEIIKANA